MLENWTRLKQDITDIKDRKEGLVLIGDYNRAIGNDSLGVKGNNSAVSYCGSLLRELLGEKEHFLVNGSDMTQGGPWTWVSRADNRIRSCIDLVIISTNLRPYISKLLVDSNQEFCPKKVGRSKGREMEIKSDHYPLILELKRMPKAKTTVKKESRWNLQKPGGWQAYKVAMEDVATRMDTITDNQALDAETIMKKNDAIMNKVKFKVFGKSKQMTKKASERRLEDRLKAAQGLDSEEKVRDLMRKQYNSMEEEINKLKHAKYGRSTNVFKMKEIVAGAKKSPQEPHAVLDAETEELVVSNEDIKKVTLKHCVKSLENNVPDEKVKHIVNLVNKVHDKRMIEEDSEEVEVTLDDFEEVVAKIEMKKKKSFDFLTKGGECFKKSIFKLCRRLIEDEDTPKRFFDTTLHQLWKIKCPREDLSNHRFIHMKDWLPKVCEGLVVSKMKESILQAGTKYQIGGKPNHRVEEHLVSVKALISRSIAKGKGSISLNYNDVFNTMKFRFKGTKPYIQEGEFNWESNTVYLGINYRFGSTKYSAKSRKNRTNDEKAGTSFL